MISLSRENSFHENSGGKKSNGCVHLNNGCGSFKG
jgi:hypothetical protein